MKKTVLIRNFLFLGAICALTFWGCTKDQAPQTNPNIDCDSLGEVSYSNDIVPLVTTYCITGQGPGTGCHDSWILSYSGLKSQVVSGNVENRVIVEKDMPVPGNTFGIPAMSEDEINTLHCWIIQGAKDN